jgi:hypothetical protein
MVRWRRRSPAAEIGDAFRTAFALQARSSLSAASSVALQWASWASSQGLVAEAADAYWALVRQVPVDVARRLAADGRTGVLQPLQGTAAESGYWLTRAGRAADAVVALELARAVVHSQRTRRVPEDLRPRLERAGHADLYGEYVAAVDRTDAVERAQYDGPHATDEAGVFVGGTWYATGAVGPAQEAWSDYQRVRAAVIAALSG